MNDESHTHAVASLADSLIECTGQLAAVRDHMAAFAASGQSTTDEPPESVLRRLLEDTLGPHLAGDPEGVQAAAELVCEAVSIIGYELFLVPADPSLDGACNGNRRQRRSRNRMH